MIHPLLRPFSASLFAWWLYLVLSPAQTGGPPSEHVRQPADDPIARQEQDREETVLYFPDYVDGGGWSVQLALSNAARRATAAIVVSAYDQEGRPVAELFDSETAFEIPPLGSRVLSSTGTGQVRRGWIEVRTDPPSVSGLLTYRNSESGVEVGVAPVELGDRFTLFAEETSEVGAGLAVYKPDPDTRIELRIRDESGMDPLGEALILGDFHQSARTLSEWFDVDGVDRGFLRDFRGLLLLRTEDEAGFAPLGLRFGKGADSLSAVPLIRDQTREAGERTLVFPDYVEGDGWSVQLALSNVDPDAPAQVAVTAHDQEGRRVPALFDSDGEFEIPSLGSRVLRSTGAGEIRRGWIQVRTGTPGVSGSLIYGHSGTGVEVGVAPVEPGNHFVLFVEESNEVGAGLAVYKPDPDSRIELRLRDESGRDPLDDLFIPWRDFRQSARTISEWFDVDGVDGEFLRDFRGLLFLRTPDGSPFAPLGLRFGKGTGALSAVPVIRIVDGVRIDGGVEIEGGVGIDGGGHAPPPTVTLSVSPSSIDRGQSATLRWSSTNAESAEITPDIGEVPTSGTRRVSPTRTTAYRITVRGADGQTATESVTVTVAISERQVLEVLYEATDGPNWVNNENWLTDAPLGEWYGVDTDASGRVVRLDLSGVWNREAREYMRHGLKGIIPPELGTLTKLNQLNLTANALTGTIPPEFGNLTNLRGLWLGSNSLTGPIPPELGNLANLTDLWLFENNLAGPIPPELGKLANLINLNLNGNDLTGPIPPELGGLSNLTHLSLGHNNFMGPIPPELGNLVRLTWLYLADNHLNGSIPSEIGGLADLQIVSLRNNALTGSIPPELGSLTNLKELWLQRNALTGPIPQSFLQLDSLRNFSIRANESLCVPGTSAFLVWLRGIEYRDGEPERLCNAVDVTVLKSLYEAIGGAEWTNSDGWLGDGAISEWYGIRTDDTLGRVTGLDLSRNGLEGRVPGSLSRLAYLTELRIDDNALSGRLPNSLTRLPLQEFHYADTRLCAPAERSFREWLNDIPSHEGTGVICAPPSDRDILVAFYDETDGPNWKQSDNWLTQRRLRNWYGVEVDGRGRVTRLDLNFNNLSGPIPPQLGSLSNLQYLDLYLNNLSGPIPPQLGSLSNLKNLRLYGNDLSGPIPQELGVLSNLSSLSLQTNDLSGPIPPQLGSLSNLSWLSLFGNDLTGPIPSELGSLSNLQYLDLYGNDLTGPIPSELGALTKLFRLDLSANDLSGSVPPELGSLSNLVRLDLSANDLSGSVPLEFGRLARLVQLAVANNVRMAGALPDHLTSLRRLEALLAGGTDLCAPSDSRFRDWLEGVWKRRVGPCRSRTLPMAYLVQPAQSRKFPVPLVAGEKALLRVFVTALHSNGESIPPVRARFYVRGRAEHVVDIPGKSARLPNEVREGNLSASVNAEVPGEIVQPGLELVVEVDPEGTLGSGLGLTKRIPETGRLAFEVRAMPVFELTVIPFLWSESPDRSVLEITRRMAADPEGHELLGDTQTLLPIGDIKVTAHEPVLSSNNNAVDLMNETAAIRAMEGGTGHYMGTMTGQFGRLDGLAMQNDWIIFSKTDLGDRSEYVIAHELGHNIGLQHPAGCNAGNPDSSFPYPEGKIGVWGYDFDTRALVSPATGDLMSYCGYGWISDYHFTNALRYRLHTAASGGLSSLVAAPARSLLLWGGVDASGTPFLEPAFVVEAPASLPRSTGDYEIVGLSAAGDELFSLTFEMRELADGDGRSSFAFVLPVQPGWADQLASITLSGPGGSVALDQDTNRPVTILRNPRSGQIRAILRGVAAALPNLDATVSALSLPAGLERLTSRGIPDPNDWIE